MSTEFFYALTPDVVLAAVETAGFHPTGHVTALNSFENRVYDLKLQDDSHVVAKFYRPGRWSKEQINEEHQFLEELADAEIPVCSPLHFADNASLHTHEGLYFALWSRTGGRAPDEFSDDQAEILGRLIGRIHMVGQQHDAPTRWDLNSDTYIHRALNILEQHNALPPHYASRYRAAAEEIAEIYDERSFGVPTQRIHGDCHKGNVLHDGEQWHLLDFDDFLVGPVVQDLWLLIAETDQIGLRQRARLIDGYRQFSHFDDAWLELIEPLRAMRYIHYAAWLTKRWEDPAFPAAFPHYGTDQYWENETADLEQQLQRIHDGVSLEEEKDRANQGEEAELTNKDFFWDWED